MQQRNQGLKVATIPLNMFEKSLLKALEQLWKYTTFIIIIIIILFMLKKRSIVPALCSRLRVHYYAQNYAGIMYLTLDHAPLNEEFIVCSGISSNQWRDLDCMRLIRQC